MDFTLTGRVTGQKLFDEVVRVVGLRESRYFGLRFTDYRGNHAWFPLDEMISSQWVNPEDPFWRFHLCVKYFPADVASELAADEVALRLLCAQVKRSILDSAIPCSQSSAWQLAAFDLQSRYGDWSENVSAKWVEERLLPGDDPKAELERQRNRERESRIVEEWEKWRGIPKRDATLRYLELVQDLESYGMEYFAVDYATEFERVSEILIGIHASGMNLCSSADQAEVLRRIEWADVKKISRHKWKFLVKLHGNDAAELIFRAESPEIHDRMYDLCRGYREHYQRRGRRRNTIRITDVQTSPREEEGENVRKKEIGQEVGKEGPAEEQESIRDLESRLEEAIELRCKMVEEVNRKRGLTEEMKRKSCQLKEICSFMSEVRKEVKEVEAKMMEAEEAALKERQKWEEVKEKAERRVRDEGKKLKARERQVQALRLQLGIIGVS